MTHVVSTMLFVVQLFAVVLFGMERCVSAEEPNRFEKNIAAFEEKDRQQFPAPGGILFIGSSSIVMWDTSRAFADLPTVNRGFGGSHISDSVHFAERIAIPYKPRLIVFYAGDNDIDAGKSPATLLADYRAFVAKVHAKLPETKIAFISIKPSLKRWAQFEKQSEANALIARFVATDKRLIYIDVVKPMLGADEEPRKERFAADELHLSERGYEVWKEVVGSRLLER